MRIRMHGSTALLVSRANFSVADPDSSPKSDWDRGLFWVRILFLLTKNWENYHFESEYVTVFLDLNTERVRSSAMLIQSPQPSRKLLKAWKCSFVDWYIGTGIYFRGRSVESPTSQKDLPALSKVLFFHFSGCFSCKICYRLRHVSFYPQVQPGVQA